MKWSRQIVQNGETTLDIEAISISPFSDSRRMEFRVRAGSMKYSTVIQLTNLASMKIEKEREDISPEEWLFEKGCRLIHESMKRNGSVYGEYLITDADLPGIDSMSLADLTHPSYQSL